MKVTLNVLSGYLKEGSLLLVAKKWLFGQCNKLIKTLIAFSSIGLWVSLAILGSKFSSLYCRFAKG
jgi:hypothetical protein